MADKKITQLATASAVRADDLFVIADDPSGAATTASVRADSVAEYVKGEPFTDIIYGTQLNLSSDNYPVMHVERTGAATGNMSSAFRFRRSTTGTMIDGAGTSMVLEIENAAGTPVEVARFGGTFVDATTGESTVDLYAGLYTGDLPVLSINENGTARFLSEGTELAVISSSGDLSVSGTVTADNIGLFTEEESSASAYRVPFTNNIDGTTGKYDLLIDGHASGGFQYTPSTRTLNHINLGDNALPRLIQSGISGEWKVLFGNTSGNATVNASISHDGGGGFTYNPSTNILTVEKVSHSGGAIWTSGSGSPEGAVTAVVGSMYTRTDGGAGTTLYVKESGTGNTGWAAK